MEKDAPVQAEWIEVESGLRAYYARPADAGPHPVVLCFIEAYGVNRHFQGLAERFAAAGFCAAVPDIFHGEIFGYDDKEGAIGKVRSLDEPQALAEAAATLDALAKRPECAMDSVALAGFCMGGRLAFRANAELADRIAAAACFYGGGIAPRESHFGRGPLLDLVPRMHAPLLLCYGVKDQSIAPDEHARIAEALSRAGLRYGLQVFPDAGHGFFCEERSTYDAAAAAESWKLMLDFFHRHGCGKLQRAGG